MVLLYLHEFLLYMVKHLIKIIFESVRCRT